MGYIAIDTATNYLAVGLGQADGQFKTGVLHHVLRGHSRLLQPAMEFALESSGISVGEIQRIGVGVGPGSYTGVRIAVATAKALAQALGVPVTPIPTLDALAVAGASRGLRGEGQETVYVLLGARRQRAFGARYTMNDGVIGTRTAAKVQTMVEWVGQMRLEALGGQHRGQRSTEAGGLVIHDLTGPDERVLRETHWAAGTLASISGSLPATLVQLTVSGDYAEVSGAHLHGLEPDYALPVEAEVNLSARVEKGE